MIIKRMNGNEEVEYELTAEELRLAYEEYEHSCDVADVRTEIESKCNEGVTEYDGIPIRCIENHIDEIAYFKRKYVDDYNMGQHTAVREALDDYIASIL